MPAVVQPTLSLREAKQSNWDVIVVGAGPAGSMAAQRTAQLGLRVLLVDREKFPRPKVCGCCVNQAGLDLLDHHDRASITAEGNCLGRYELASGGRVAAISLSGGVAISRERLDSYLIRAAIRSGAQFLDATHAVFDSDASQRGLSLRRGQETGDAPCRTTVLATGLSGLRRKVDAARGRSWRSYIGGGVILKPGGLGPNMGTVWMACHRSGYVGLVQLEDRRVDVAAALDAQFVKQLGGLSNAAHHVLSESGLSVPTGLQANRWHGTVRLTHRRTQLYGDGYLVVGDAAGYVEPFTGEGIAWAMAGGQAVAEFARRSLTEPITTVGPAWSRHFRRLLGGRVNGCRTISFLLRQPMLVQLAVRTLKVRPQLAAPIERLLNTPFELTE